MYATQQWDTHHTCSTVLILWSYTHSIFIDAIQSFKWNMKFENFWIILLFILKLNACIHSDGMTRWGKLDDLPFACRCCYSLLTANRDKSSHYVFLLPSYGFLCREFYSALALHCEQTFRFFYAFLASVFERSIFMPSDRVTSELLFFSSFFRRTFSSVIWMRATQTPN